uniref:Uncharacterized protein n=1 Tax=uncultured alpha proteobacterium EF100_102A06 TaxID=710799 RepID=E0Y285_9PROT|nr:hypothetical protein [uncultured alpha proteobacterium EF100_102A06]
MVMEETLRQLNRWLSFQINATRSPASLATLFGPKRSRLPHDGRSLKQRLSRRLEC